MLKSIGYDKEGSIHFFMDAYFTALPAVPFFRLYAIGR
ncbi:hypothetical protein C900_02683 [Fulvivirga imtechensis AK7]|uniref:Uncharacterized protein n=1 Tax=Fulvivirga imtechensis AK7 TaxID=1237149 RepID=L8JZL0_9BACT|nr:hypothetical protein C900_02683 [Fulvivirga imtechensis AK7]